MRVYTCTQTEMHTPVLLHCLLSIPFLWWSGRWLLSADAGVSVSTDGHQPTCRTRDDPRDWHAVLHSPRINPVVAILEDAGYLCFNASIAGSPWQTSSLPASCSDEWRLAARAFVRLHDDRNADEKIYGAMDLDAYETDVLSHAYRFVNTRHTPEYLRQARERDTAKHVLWTPPRRSDSRTTTTLDMKSAVLTLRACFSVILLVYWASVSVRPIRAWWRRAAASTRS